MPVADATGSRSICRLGSVVAPGSETAVRPGPSPPDPIRPIIPFERSNRGLNCVPGPRQGSRGRWHQPHCFELSYPIRQPLCAAEARDMQVPAVLIKFFVKASLNAVGGGVAGDFAVEVLPGIARDVWNWWGKNRSEAQRRADLEALVALPPADLASAVDQAMKEVAGAQSTETRARAANFVKLVPEAIHLSLVRKDDP